MTAPIPLPESTLLIRRANELRKQCPYNEIELASCEKEARRLMGISEFYADAASVLGMLAAIKDDVNGVIKWHELAIQASGGDPYYYEHYAVSLYRLFEYERALNAAKYAFKMTAAKDCLDIMIRSASCLGDENAAGSYILEWNRLYSEDYPDIEFVGEENFIDSMLGYLTGQIDNGEEILNEDTFDMDAIRELVDEIRKEQ